MIVMMEENLDLHQSLYDNFNVHQYYTDFSKHCAILSFGLICLTIKCI